VALSGCGEKTFEPPDREARVAEADSRLTPQTFDTISWESDEARGMAGNVTFSAKCRNCHGTLGEGNTTYGNDRGLEVPNLADPDWRWADSIDAVRRRVFIGHAEGMPTWGVAGITPREIDGVAYYVLEVLRSDPAATP
jgi:mono/diheme cytochrome c family protein